MKTFGNSSISLVNKIITLFVGYMIIVIFLFSGLIYIVENASVKSINKSYAQDIVAMEATMVTDWMEDNVNLLKSLSAMTNAKTLSNGSAIEALKITQQNYPNVYQQLYLVDIDRKYRSTLDKGDTGTTMQNDPFAARIFEGEDYIIVEPTLHPQLGEVYMNILVPIKEEDVVIGLLGATIKMNELSDRLSGYKIKGAGFGWLINSEYGIIAHPLTNHILKVSLKSQKSLDENGIEGSQLISSKEFGYKGLEDVAEELDKNQVATATYTDLDGYKRTVTFAEVKGSQSWYVAFTTFNDKIPTTITTLIIYMAIGLLFIVIVSIITSYYFATDITKPINQLIHVVTLFTNGNKGVRSTVVANDEIGTLAKAFNGMADTIIEHTDNVEELIKERTQMLADLNYQIVSRNNELNTMNVELESTNNKLHTLATTDMLTGLQNRHELVRTLQSYVDDVLKGNDQGFSVLFVDLDNFKYYNDTYSHEIGDFLLMEVSKILKANVRDLDMVARYGGDEFVILLKHGDFEVSKMLSERIHSKILEKNGFKKEIERKIGSEIMLLGKNKLSCSIGIVNYNKSVNAKNADELLALADDTMYKAKKAGKSRIVVN